MTELEARMKVVNVIRSWIGGYEGGAIHQEILNTYNNHKPLAQGYTVKSWDAWCATTVSAAFIKAGMTSIAPTECSCPRMINLYKNIGRWIENDAYVPQPGDIIMYDWQDSGAGDNVGTADHVGIVESCDGANITVIEGNMSNSVGRRNLKVNGRYIRGYCCPDYASFVGSKPASKPIDSTDYSALIEKAVKAGDFKAAAKYEQKRNEKIDALIASGITTYQKTYKYVSYLNDDKLSVEEVAKEVIDGKWGTGTTRKQKLTAAGYDYDEVQKMVNKLLAGNTSTSAALSVGDEVKLKSGAKYTNGSVIPTWVINSKLYVRELRGDSVVFSTLKTGAITGVADKKYFTKTGANSSYKVKVTADALNVRSGPGTNYKINDVIRDKGTYVITEEKNGWGKLSNGKGWIALNYTKKV